MLNGRVREILEMLTAEELAIGFINSNIEKLLVYIIFAKMKHTFWINRMIHCILYTVYYIQYILDGLEFEYT